MKKNNNEGWVCPKCGRVYAPWVEKCQYCGGNTITYTPFTCPCRPWCINDTITTDRVTINANDFGTTTYGSTTITNQKEV